MPYFIQKSLVLYNINKKKLNNSDKNATHIEKRHKIEVSNIFEIQE